jgi:F0F1-type ATP synthase membrane subunit b/b'
MGTILSLLFIPIIAVLGYIVKQNIKLIKELEFNVDLLKNANKLDHNKVNQKLDAFELKYKKQLANFKTELQETRVNLTQEINHSKENIEVSTKKYLNGWRNSTEFKTMLELIKKSDQSSTTKNTY